MTLPPTILRPRGVWREHVSQDARLHGAPSASLKTQRVHAVDFSLHAHPLMVLPRERRARLARAFVVVAPPLSIGRAAALPRDGRASAQHQHDDSAHGAQLYTPPPTEATT